MPRTVHIYSPHWKNIYGKEVEGEKTLVLKQTRKLLLHIASSIEPSSGDTVTGHGSNGETGLRFAPIHSVYVVTDTLLSRIEK